MAISNYFFCLLAEMICISLLDFMVMTTVLNIFSAMVVILNAIGLEMYSRFCASGRAKEWIGECGTVIVFDVFM